MKITAIAEPKVLRIEIDDDDLSISFRVAAPLFRFVVQIWNTSDDRILSRAPVVTTGSDLVIKPDLHSSLVDIERYQKIIDRYLPYLSQQARLPFMEIQTRPLWLERWL